MARLALSGLGLVLCLVAADAAWAQSGRPTFAPGVLTYIPPEPLEEELFTEPRELVELQANIKGLDVTPNFAAKTTTVGERAKQAILRRTIWNLEFAFKPMRMLMVDVPQPTGRLERKRIWYMVYKVRNPGGHWKPVGKEVLTPTEEDTRKFDTFTKETTDEVKGLDKDPTALRFFPQFTFYSAEYDKTYLDRIIPAALAPIKAREFPGQGDVALHNSVSISEVSIPVTTDTEDGVWGVVTWENIDPRIQYISVFVRGLTNAYRYEDPMGAYKAGDPPGSARKFQYKVLQLNFWRAGDPIDERENEIHFGVRVDSDPSEQLTIFDKYGVKERLDYLWTYR